MVEDVKFALLVILVGIVLAILVHYALGLVVIIIGLVMLFWPKIKGLSRRGR